VAAASDVTEGLVGHWKLAGDCRDHSGHGNHGENHGVDLETSSFDGSGAYISVPNHPSLRLQTSDFTLSAWVYTHPDDELDDVVGDVMDLYDPALRKGITLSINSSSSGYQGQGTDRQVCFGIDNARTSEWIDCGRPSRSSNFVSNSLVAFQGKLYAAITDGSGVQDWCHVYRYEGDQQWSDCGRVGSERTAGVGPLIVHQGQLYAATWTYDWTRVQSGGFDQGRVYRYAGGTQWIDCGRPSDNRTLTCLASFKGKLYVGGGPETWGVFVQQRERDWSPSQLFPRSGPRKCFPHSMSRYNGKLYVAFPSAYAFDGQNWTYAGVPVSPEEILQTHSLRVYQGQLCAGTWPEAKVARYAGGEEWLPMGRVGTDGTEVNALVVYNGKLYGGSIPRAEVCRYDGQPQWTSLIRFYSPEGWQPQPPSELGGQPSRAALNEWSRVTSLTIYDGSLFASIGSCTSSILDAPADVRGRVFRMQAGRCVSFDHDLGPGWKHLAAVRAQAQLKLYVDGQLAATSAHFEPAEYDLSTDQPLRIGFGQTDYFSGKIREVRIYNRALANSEIAGLSRMQP
jgi:hypothetical protein